MAVYIYNDGEHPANFIGVRVSRSIAGKVYQKYFSFRKEMDTTKFVSIQQQNKLINNAVRLDKQLAEQQEWARKEAKWFADNSHLAREGSHTGINGITLQIDVSGKEKGKRYQYYRFGYRVCMGHGKRDKDFYISELGYEGAWREAVSFWLDRHGFDQSNLETLLIRLPKPKRFQILLNQMNKEGWNIPKSALHLIFAEYEKSNKG